MEVSETNEDKRQRVEEGGLVNYGWCYACVRDYIQIRLEYAHIHEPGTVQVRARVTSLYDPLFALSTSCIHMSSG